MLVFAARFATAERSAAVNEEQSIPDAVYPFLNFQLLASHTTSTGRPFDDAPLANSAITHAYFPSSDMAVLEIRRSAGLPGSGINETVRFALVQLFTVLVVDDEDDVGGVGFEVEVEVELRRAVVLDADDELDPPQAPSATMSAANATPLIPRTADVDFIATSTSCPDPCCILPDSAAGLSSPIRSDVTAAERANNDRSATRDAKRIGSIVVATRSKQVHSEYRR